MMGFSRSHGGGGRSRRAALGLEPVNSAKTSLDARPVLASHRRSPATIGWRWVAIAFSFIAFALFTVAVPIAASASAASVVPHRAVDPVLTVHKVGAPADGTVTSLAPYTGIDCGLTCSHNFGFGTVLTLHAQPDGGSEFTGWSAGCTVVDPITGDCQVLLTIVPVTVTATFALLPPPTHLLTVDKAGTPADGTVTSEPAGIDCGVVCSHAFTAGDVTLTAEPDGASEFTGWSGSGIACPGTGPCVVTMSAAHTVTATFALLPPPTHLLTVDKAGTPADGTVTSCAPPVSTAALCALTPSPPVT